ncbi:ABC transporter substrate-binding protein, partial [Cupriavidus sp. WS]
MYNLISRTRRAVLLAAGLGAALACGAAAAQVKEIPIGFVLPLSGGAATIGNQTKQGAEIAAEQINQAGGIRSLGGAKLKLIFADSQSKPDVGVAETERLIQRENVPLIVGAYNSAVTFPATEVAERYKVPWVVTGAVKDEITERGFKYVFRPNNKAIYDA